MTPALLPVDFEQMPVHIFSQTQMQRITRGTRFCYLCGHRFKPGQAIRSGEHVVMRAFLGEPTGDNCWPVLLPVHEKCELLHKDRRDSLVNAWHRFMALGPESITDTNHRRDILEYLDWQPVGENGELKLVFTRVAEMRRAVWTWVRGLYACLYGQYLPEKVRCDVIPPVPSYLSPSATFDGRGVAETERITKSLLSLLLHGAFPSRQFDGISAWGGSMVFICTWLLDSDGTTSCVWCLSSQTVEKLSLDIDWRKRPWHGTFRPHYVPPNATRYRL